MHYMWILEVVPIKRGLPQDMLTYFSAEQVADGSLVSVPIRSKLVDAIVIGSRDAREEKAAIKSGSFSLKKISKVKSTTPVPGYIFETATMIAHYYRRTRGEMLDLIVTDYTHYAALGKLECPRVQKIDDDTALPERLVFQAPLEDRVSFYKTYIRESFARKESVTFVCPTISDCDLFLEYLSRGIADFVVVLHSELTKKKIGETIQKLSSEQHPFVLICTPSYASLIRPDLGTMFLEHESSTAYNTPSAASFDFRVVIEVLTRLAGKKLIVADSLLRVETLGRYEAKEFLSAGSVSFRALAPIEPTIIPHGTAEQIAKRNQSEQIPALSEPMMDLLGKTVAKKSHVFAFTLRTGLATVTRCRECFLILSCEYCEAPLVLYQSGNRRVFICNKCKRHKPSETVCTRCGSGNLSPYGLGTEYVEEEIKRLHPDLPVFRIDREATPTRAEARKIAALFAAAPAGILVGTEMALFYLTDSVTDSIIVSFDTLFNIPSYRTNERIIELFLSIAERTRGKLYVQTKNPHEPIIELIQANNYSGWYRSELKEREEYNYPPYSTIIKITWSGKDTEREATRERLAEVLAAFAPDIFDTTVIRRGKREIAVNAIIRPKREDWSVAALLSPKGLSETLTETLKKLPDGCMLSINPDNLL